MSNGGRVWVASGPFVKGVSVAVAPSAPYFPMSPARVVAVELNVRKGHNDQIAALVAGVGAPSGALYVTMVSRGA